MKKKFLILAVLLILLAFFASPSDFTKSTASSWEHVSPYLVSSWGHISPYLKEALFPKDLVVFWHSEPCKVIQNFATYS